MKKIMGYQDKRKDFLMNLVRQIPIFKDQKEEVVTFITYKLKALEFEEG